MSLSLSSLLLSVLSLCTFAASASLTIAIPPSTQLPNPHVLPPTTHATLTTLPSSIRSGSNGDSSKKNRILTAPLTRSASFIFPELPSAPGSESYLLDIRAAGEYTFAPYRVDVAADGSLLGIWETFPGNTWENRGAEKYVVDVAAGSTNRADVRVDAKVLGRKTFYEERDTFSVLALFKNPMILMAVVALGITFGMPKLMDSMDPEMRAEFEQHQRASAISGATNNAMAGGGFDLAGWMAGTASGTRASADAARGSATGRESGGAARRRA